ncbi:MAG: hypothetical protein Q9201_006857, partial [Fulgogasparrea decipioides]
MVDRRVELCAKQHHRGAEVEGRAEGDRPETLPGVGTETVDHGEHGAEQQEGHGKTQPTPQAHEQPVEVHQLGDALHHPRADQEQRYRGDHHHREDGTEGEGDGQLSVPAAGLVNPVGDVERLGEGAGHGHGVEGRRRRGRCGGCRGS